jgi:L-ascorbate metabolism protein UlaG (beta-lactamase superfamily)
MEGDIVKGNCKLNNVPSFIRKINKVGERTIICFHYGRASGMMCEDIEKFKKRFKYTK